MYSKLFHKDVYLPQGTQALVCDYQKQFNEYFYSKHFEDRINNCDDRSHEYLGDVVKQCLSTIKGQPQEAFEVEFSKDYHYFGVSGWFLTKYCIRIPYSANQDLCVAIRPQYSNGKYTGNNMIVTAWLNSKTDKHFTLDESKYCYEL